MLLYTVCTRCRFSEMLMSPLVLTGLLGSVDIDATVTLAQSEVVRTTDGTPLLDPEKGFSARASAMRLAIARAVCAFVPPEMREKLRIGTLLYCTVYSIQLLPVKILFHLGERCLWYTNKVLIFTYCEQRCCSVHFF